MINHFKTRLLNRAADFFTDSLFPVHTDTEFKPSPLEEWSRHIDRTLFGVNPDASLVDYRFFQFLRVIDACHLREHVRRYDPRETYRTDQYEPYRDELFESCVTPAQGLTVTEEHAIRPEFLRKTFAVLNQSDRIIVLGRDGRSDPVATTVISSKRIRIDALGLTLTVSRPGSWLVDYRRQPDRSISDLVKEINDLPVTVLRSLFESASETAPEYEEGFRTITDSLTRFCMVLFAQAVANERLQERWENGPKRVERGVDDLPDDTPGTFYYGCHPNESLRMKELQNELQCSTGVCHRRQTVEIAVPQMGYLYLAWPVRFGLPARSRIVVDGLLNSAWNIFYLDDRKEQYVVFRSNNKIRTETPVRIEIP